MNLRYLSTDDNFIYYIFLLRFLLFAICFIVFYLLIIEINFFIEISFRDSKLLMEKDKDFESPGGTAEKNCEFQRTSPMKLSSCNTREWRSVTKDSFPPPENIQVQGIGKN